MTYSTIDDVRREFKSVLEQGTIITDDKIVEFQLQMFATINSYIGTRFVVPVVGTNPVNKKDTITFSAAVGASEIKTVQTVAQGQTKTYSYTTLGADSAQVQRDALLALIVADSNRIVEAVASGTDDLVLESRVLGFAYTATVSGAVIVNNVAAVLGSSSVRLLRRIETELTACKIASILRTKVAEKLSASGVRQDIKDESCGKMALSLLKDIQDGTAELEDASLVNTGSGLESHNQKTGYEGFYSVEKRQW